MISQRHSKANSDISQSALAYFSLGGPDDTAWAAIRTGREVGRMGKAVLTWTERKS